MPFFRRRSLAVLAGVDLTLVVLALATLVFWSSISSADSAITVQKVDEATFTPQPRTEPFFILLVGNDARPGLEGIRGDGIHLLGVNPAAGSATILNIPRDTYVPVPGFGSAKINEGYLLGGLQKQLEAVSVFTGVNFSFVVTTNFDGFQAMVDEMGGMVVDVPYRMFDRASGADFEPGSRHMMGPGALSYARNRNIPGGDISRTTHHGQLLQAALTRAREVTHSPVETMRLVGMISRHTRFEGVGLQDFYGLVTLGLSIDPANVRNVTMPSRVGQVGKASVVFAGAGADSLFADFRDDGILQSH